MKTVCIVVLCLVYYAAGGALPGHYKAPLYEEVIAPAYGAPVYEEVLSPGYGYNAPLVASGGYGAPLVAGVGYTGGYGAPLLSSGGYGGYGAPLVSSGGYGGYGAPLVSSDGYGGYGAPIVASDGYGAPIIEHIPKTVVAAAPVVEEIVEPLNHHKVIKEEAYDHEHDSAYRLTQSDNINALHGATALAGAAYYPTGHLPLGYGHHAKGLPVLEAAYAPAVVADPYAPAYSHYRK